MIFALVQKMTNFKKFIVGLVIVFIVIACSLASAVSASSSSVVIYQVQTGSVASASQEFLSIYNNSPGPVDVTGWCVIYSSASDVTQSQLACLSPPDNQTRLWLSGHSSVLLASNEFILANTDAQIDLPFKSGMATTSGHVKLLNSEKDIVDLVGWGAASKPEGSSATAHTTGNVLQRSNINEQELIDTDNNSADFHQANLVLSESGLYEEYVEPGSADSLLITEILPDAIGADSGNEFIEIYNPNDNSVSLNGYVLQIGPSYSKSFVLPDLSIESGHYLALLDGETKVTLPNTSGSVRLLDPFGNVLSTTDPYENLGEGVAWSLFDNSWHITYQPSPGSRNIRLDAKPCQEGHTRNADTGRCRKALSLTSSLKPCKPGEFRSLETNRCRSISSKSNSKTPCKPDQIRNPATGRCKKIATASAGKPCSAGQERNKETNRCRKIPPPINKNEIKDIESPLVTGDFKWWLAGVSAFGSVGYGVYEWRREVFQVLEGLRLKLWG